MISKSEFLSDILPFYLTQEGGYANIKGDTGGETYRGISRKKNPSWSGWKVVDSQKPLKYNQLIPSLENSVKEFYYQNYFIGAGLDALNSVKVALVIFDFYCNGGFSHNILKTELQKRYGKTFMSNNDYFGFLNRMNETELANLVMQLRENHYNKLTQSSQYAKFKTGWNRRLIALRAYINLPYIGFGVGFILLGLLAYFIYKKRRSIHGI